MRLRLMEWSSRLLNELARAAQGPKGGGDSTWLFELFDPPRGAAAGEAADGEAADGEEPPAASSDVRVDPLAAMLDGRGAPADPAVRAAWSDAYGVRGDLELAAALVQLAGPDGPEAWIAAASAYRGTPVATLRPLVAGLGEQRRRVPADALLAIARQLRGQPAVRRFLAAVRDFRSARIPDGEVERTIADHVASAEEAAVVAELGRLLLRRRRTDYGLDDVRRLLEALGTRVAAKRWAVALALLDDHGVHVDELDTFVLGFASAREDLRWLQAAVAELQDAGKPITRLGLMGLREWAPDEQALVRYSRGVRSLADSGLTPEEIDTYLLPHLQDEEGVAVAAMIGQVGRRLYGRLTLAMAQDLRDRLPGRAAVKRFERASELLREAGLGPADVEALASSFVGSREDVIWLEALVRTALDTGRRLERLELMHLRERCPDPGSLYLYFRLRAELERYAAIAPDEREALAIDVAGLEGGGDGLLAMLKLLARRGRAPSAGAGAVRALHAAFPDPDAVRRFDRATSSLAGSAAAVDALAVDLATDDERAAAIHMVGRALAARGMHDVDANPGLRAGLVRILARLDAERGGKPGSKPGSKPGGDAGGDRLVA